MTYTRTDLPQGWVICEAGKDFKNPSPAQVRHVLSVAEKKFFQQIFEKGLTYTAVYDILLTMNGGDIR